MRNLERQVGKIETVLTRVADDVQPHARPVHHMTKRVVVIKEVKQEMKHKHPAIKRHQSARPVEKKQAEPVIINNDARRLKNCFNHH